MKADDPGRAGDSGGGPIANDPKVTVGPSAGSPLKLGSVGTLSGPVGATLGGLVKGAQVWVRWINDRGGVNGHQIQLKVWDDANDPARHRAQVQEAVETFHVVGFLAEVGAFTAEGSQAYIHTKQIPVVGTDTTSQYPDQWPMYFNQNGYGKSIIYIAAGTIVRRAEALGLKRFGTLVCELPQCDQHEGWWHEYTSGHGVQSVYRGKASLVQPDFTAECLAARNANVEILAISMDTNSVDRIASSCARQGYHPVFASGGPNMVPRFAKDPNLDGMILGANVLPYGATANPALVEFLDAMKRYAPGAAVAPAEEQGWVAGKLLEVAARALPEPPTSAALLEGLWSIKNETLGGLTQPLSFIKGKPTSQNPSCGFDMIAQKGTWASLDAFEMHCGDPK